MTVLSLTQHEFTLPLGYTDAAGRVHRRGLMRLATAFDEIEPLADARVQANEAFLGLLLLSRVVTRLGDFAPVPPEVIAGLYTADFAYLQALYTEVNTPLGRAAPWAGLPGASAYDQGAVQSGGTLAGTLGGAAPSGPAPLGSVETTCPHCGAELVLDLDT